MGSTLNFNINLIQPNKCLPARILFRKITKKKIKTQLNNYLDMNVIVLSKVTILNYGCGIYITRQYELKHLDATVCKSYSAQ